MRFNQEDLKKGNVSKERIEEVVQRTILKVDNRLFNPQDLYRTKSNLIDILQKLFIFKRSDFVLSDGVGANEEVKEMGQKKFWNRLKKANDELIKAEVGLHIQQAELHREALMARKIEAEKRFAAKLIDEMNYQQLLQEINQELEEIKRLQDQQKEWLDNIRGLEVHRDSLIDRIRENENSIVVARESHANVIIKNSDQIMMGNKKYFEGMSPKNVDLFVKGRLAILEVKHREIDKLNAWKEEKRNELVESKPGKIVTQFRKSQDMAKIDREFEKKLLNIEKNEINKFRELVHAADCKVFAPGASDDVLKGAMAAYDANKVVKAEQGKFVEVLKEKLGDNRVALNEIKANGKKIVNHRLALEVNLNELQQQEMKLKEGIEISTDALNLDRFDSDSTSLDNFGDLDGSVSLEDFGDLDDSMVKAPDTQNDTSQISLNDCTLANLDFSGQTLATKHLENASKKTSGQKNVM